MWFFCVLGFHPHPTMGRRPLDADRQAHRRQRDARWRDSEDGKFYIRQKNEKSKAARAAIKIIENRKLIFDASELGVYLDCEPETMTKQQRKILERTLLFNDLPTHVIVPPVYPPPFVPASSLFDHLTPVDNAELELQLDNITQNQSEFNFNDDWLQQFLY